jgi:hypothetical protein
MINLLDDVAPTSNELGAVSELAQRQLELEDEVKHLEEQLKQAKQNLKQVSETDLPDLMNNLNIKEFKLNDGTKVSVNDIISGSIPSHGSIQKAHGSQRQEIIARQDQCFDHLRMNNAESMIKNNVVVQFQSGEDAKAQRFKKKLESLQLDFIYKSEVHPRTLNAWLKEQIQNGKDIPFDAFKIFTGHRATIKRS